MQAKIKNIPDFPRRIIKSNELNLQQFIELMRICGVTGKEFSTNAQYNRGYFHDLKRKGRFNLKHVDILRTEVGERLFNEGLIKLSKRQAAKNISFDELIGRYDEAIIKNQELIEENYKLKAKIKK